MARSGYEGTSILQNVARNRVSDNRALVGAAAMVLTSARTGGAHRRPVSAMKHPSAEAALRELLAKQAIELNLATHSRGVDRADHPTLRSAYHDEADTAYGAPALELIRALADSHRRFPATLHRTCNTWIHLGAEDRALSESYVIAYLETVAGGARTQRLIGGRYLDRHLRKEGCWALVHRSYVLDWNLNQPSTDAWPETAGALFAPRGGKGAADPGSVLLATWGAALAKETKPMSASPALERDLDLALSRQALRELSMAYCRGIDRADGELLASVFHDDATVVVGIANGPASQYVGAIVRHVQENLERCFHSLANEWFQISGDRAVGESYAIVVLTSTEDGRDIDTIVGGRYLDRFERRRGVWKIAERVFVTDWNIRQPSTAVFDDEFYGGLKLRGRYGRDDPVYAFWNAGTS